MSVSPRLTSSKVGSGAWRNLALGCHLRYCEVSLAEMASMAFWLAMVEGSAEKKRHWILKCSMDDKGKGGVLEAGLPIQASSLAQGLVLITSGGVTPMFRHMTRPSVKVLPFYNFVG